MMQTVMKGISDNWIWLGPLLCLAFGWIIIELAWSILTGVWEELQDGTEEWAHLRRGFGGQGKTREQGKKIEQKIRGSSSFAKASTCANASVDKSEDRGGRI